MTINELMGSLQLHEHHVNKNELEVLDHALQTKL